MRADCPVFSAPFSMTGGGDESSDDDDAGALAGLSLPTFGAPAGGAEEEESRAVDEADLGFADDEAVDGPWDHGFDDI